MMCRWDHVLLQWEHLDLTLFCALGHGDLGRDLAWPLSWKLRACVWMSELRRRGPELRWASLGNVLFSEGVPWPSQGAVLQQALSLSLPGSPSLGHGGPSGGLPGNHSNFPAPSGWVGRQVHPVNWLQGSGKKSAGSRWGCGCDLLPADSPRKRTGLPLDSQPSSPVPSSSQRDKTDRARQSQGGVFTSSTSFQTRKKSHRTKVKTGGAWLLRDCCGERRGPVTSF